MRAREADACTGAMTHYDRLKRKRLGDVLVDEGLATEETVIAALHEQQRSGHLLSDILLDQDRVAEEQLALAIVEHYQVPYVDLKNYAVHKDLIQGFPAPLLHRARVVPLDRYGKQVCFACQEIPPKDVVDELKRHAPGGLYFYVAQALEVRRVLGDYAPLAQEAAPVGAAAAAAPKAKQAAKAVATTDEDTAWKDLFDAANESILSDLKDPDE